MKNMFCIFCAFCMLCLPGFSESYSSKNLSKNTSNNENYTISAINLNAINTAFKTDLKSVDNNDCTIPLALCLQQKKEFEALKIPKGTKFLVKSKQDLSDKTKNGANIIFESVYPEKIYPNSSPSKLVFKGKITKTRQPQIAGNGGLVKVVIDKMTVGNLTYPVSGMITKINNKPVYFNNIKGDFTYFANTAQTANMRNGILNKMYRDPCEVFCTDTNALIAPLYLLSGAILQTSNLVLSPVSAVFKSGKNVYVSNNSKFVIKLDEDVFVLKI